MLAFVVARVVIIEQTDNTAAWLALGVAGAALLWGIGWAIYQHRADNTRDGRLTKIEAQKADELGTIGRAVAAGIDPAAAHAHGAAISVFLVSSTSRASITDRLVLVVKNLGPGGASVRELRPIERDDGRWDRVLGRGETLPGGAVELLPGEEHYTDLNLVMGTPWPIEIFVAWLDGTGQEKQRVVALSFPP